MKIFLNTLGVLLVLAGGIFFLQGLSILPGTFMRGNPQWVINGGVMVVIGAGLLWWGNRRK